jgi:hypothetical protein
MLFDRGAPLLPSTSTAPPLSLLIFTCDSYSYGYSKVLLMFSSILNKLPKLPNMFLILVPIRLPKPENVESEFLINYLFYIGG